MGVLQSPPQVMADGYFRPLQLPANRDLSVSSVHTGEC
jgi:hypothetical protein